MKREQQYNLHQNQLRIRCENCHQSCLFQATSEVGSDASSEVFIIRMDDNIAYCLKCLEGIIKEEMREVRSLQQRYIYHKQFQSSFEQREMVKQQIETQSVAASKAEEELIVALRSEEQELNRQISKVKQDSNQLKEKIYALEAEEEKFWQGINKIQKRTNKVEEKSLNTKFDKNMQKDLIDELSKLSVIHLFMDIRVDDSIALVQGMALGKRAENIQIMWEEVAVGLGHLLIGLNLLVLKYSYEYKRIQQIKFKGSYSEIVLREKQKVCSLFYSKENERVFGDLLEALLQEIFFLSQHMLETENIEYSEEYKLPFVINVAQCKIADLNIDPLKIEERLRWSNWTKAMRYLLIDFKHMLTVYAINDKCL